MFFCPNQLERSYRIWSHMSGNTPATPFSSLKKYRLSFFVTYIILTNFRSGHLRCSVRKSVLRNFAKFTGKRLCLSLYLNKVAGLETLAQGFSCEFCKISKNKIFTEHVWATASKILFSSSTFISLSNYIIEIYQHTFQRTF